MRHAGAVELLDRFERAVRDVIIAGAEALASGDWRGRDAAEKVRLELQEKIITLLLTTRGYP
jgi:hypothetical protein